MRAIKARELKKQYRAMGPVKMNAHLTEALDNKDLKPEDFDFAELAEAFLSREFFRSCDPRNPDADEARRILYEGEDAVDSTAFLDITQRVISATVMENFMMESGIAAGLIDLEPNIRVRNERRPGITPIGDFNERVHEGMPFPRQNRLGDKFQDFGDNYKRGLIVGLTKESLFFVGLSAEITRQAARVGEWLGVNKDKRIWEVILGISNNFNYGGNAYNTYNATNQQVGGLTIAPANIHDRQLRDWTDIDYAERLFDAMTDPDTGESIEIGGQTLIVMPPRWANAKRILAATTVWHGDIDGAARGAISNTIDIGDVTTLANPDVVEEIRIMVQGKEKVAAKEGPEDLKRFGEEG